MGKRIKKEAKKSLGKHLKPFHHCMLCKWGLLAIALTTLFLFTELTSPITPDLLGNMAAVILAIGVILAMFLTVSQARALVTSKSY